MDRSTQLYNCVMSMGTLGICGETSESLASMFKYLNMSEK